ncbi:hypothetical protein L6164_034026 [Bauhinia variegata]|uniref:Uncharacterized protein n=1 Tax=Bauhinia variegata TaxID=167791 RepID=A0ACB9KTN0_BAUVA|nr:hypothetical protein L6164_034026 [Bauhinia variegata]
MRIRKRQVPFPLSSLSPVPLSDPHLINRSPVVQLNDATPPEVDAPGTTAVRMDRQPSDQQLPPIGKARDGSDSSGNASESGIPKEEVSSEMSPRKDQNGEGGEKTNDTRRGGILGSETSAEVLPPSSPSRQADGRWCDGEKAIPLKKRRGTFDVSENNNKKMKTRMKTKMNKKCSTSTWTQNDNEVEDEEEEEEETKRDLNVGKKRTRGSALMEGSRCSRVNGRGWRCCQQTLVGYSLCEHHLGKGRLRSMTSVRSRSAATTTDTSTAPKKKEPVSVSVSVSETDLILVAADLSSSDPEKKQSKFGALGNDDGEESEEKKPLITTKKRMKLGMVKARSISSLLGQTNTNAAEIAVAENNK